MQQGPSKQDPGGREERNKRDPNLKMCLPGDAGAGLAFGERGDRNLRMPDSRPERERAGREAWAALLGVTSHTGSPCL